MDLLSRHPPAADHRIPYGPDPSQFGDLWLPGGGHPAPVLVFVHGGWWKSAYDLQYGGHLCNALRSAGLAVWSIEYRRVGATGGGWPNTFIDVAAGFDHLGQLARTYPLDLRRVVVSGHSAGGHLAFWLAGRHHIFNGSPLHDPQPRVPLHAVVSLAGAVDLQLTIDLSGHLTFAHDRREVLTFMGADPASQPDRYLAGDPGHLLPLNLPQLLIQGAEDDQIPPDLPERWAEKARRQGDEVTLLRVPGADHFDIVDPESKAWSTVEASILRLFRS